MEKLKMTLYNFNLMEKLKNSISQKRFLKL